MKFFFWINILFLIDFFCFYVVCFVYKVFYFIFVNIVDFYDNFGFVVVFGIIVFCFGYVVGVEVYFFG